MIAFSRMSKTVLVASLLALCVLVVLWGARWGSFLRSGHGHATMRLESIGADLFSIDVPELFERGKPTIWVLRFDGPVDLVPHHFQNNDDVSEPQDAAKWAQILDAPVVLNAGQFDETFRHLGWLKANGEWLKSVPREKWKGLLVSGPKSGAPWSGVIDLARENPDIAQDYNNVVQSMMLVDDNGAVRVRDSDRTASRTVIAQDGQGRIVILITEGAATLAALARWLPTSELDVRRAMNLDGGVESQLVIHTQEVTKEFFGQYGTGTTMFDGRIAEVRFPLPAVIVARPMKQEQQQVASP